MKDNFVKGAEDKLINAQDADRVGPAFFTRWICQHKVTKPVHDNKGLISKVGCLLSSERLPGVNGLCNT